jgi:serine protease AprX
MRNFLRLLTLIAAASLALAASKNPKIADDLLTVSPNQNVDVIVQYALPNFGGNQGNNNQQGDFQGQFGAFNSFGNVKQAYNHVSSVHMSIRGSYIPFLAYVPFVKYISKVRPTKGTQDVTKVVNATVAWSSGFDGAGVGVAVIDSGIYAHDDLKKPDGTGSRVVYSESFVSGLDASDQYGHGTHVAGIVGSNGNDSAGLGFTHTFRGIAPKVNLINLRVLDANGGGTDASVIAAIDRAIQLKSTYNIRVINLSLGRPAFESYTLDPLCQAVEAAWNAGIVVVTAAGNYGRDNSKGEHGYGTIVSPGIDPYVITVGAMNTMGTLTRTDDHIASYSSKGPTVIDHIVKPDLVAPGNGIVSLRAPNSTLAANSGFAVPNSYYRTGGVGSSGNYLRLSGTSMATPVVAGAAALLIQQNPWLTPDQVKARLMKTAQKVLPLFPMALDSISHASFNLQSDIFAVGAGYLDVQAALYNTDFTTQPALSAVAVYSSSTHKVTITRSFLTSWGSSVVWGDTLVYGLDVLNGTDGAGFSVVWGDSMIWGMDDGGGGFSVVWGDSTAIPDTMQALDSGDDDLFTVVWGD